MRYCVNVKVGTNKASLAYPDVSNWSVENFAIAIDKCRRGYFQPRSIINVNWRLEVRRYTLTWKALG